jgi:pimeloyl-ACP methyl ester carboxylesterase
MHEPHASAPKLAPDNHGLIWLPTGAFAAAFAQNATAEEQAVLAAVQRPISPACITVPVGRPLWLDIPSWYLLAEQDRMIVPKTQRFMAERMQARISVHPVDHTPSVTAPRAVADLLTDVVHQIKP